MRIEREQREIFQREQEEMRREKGGVIPTIAKVQNDISTAVEVPDQFPRFKQQDRANISEVSRRNTLFDEPSPEVSVKQKSKASLFAPPSPSNSGVGEDRSPRQQFMQPTSPSKNFNSNNPGSVQFPASHGVRSPRDPDTDNLVKKFQSEAIRAQKEAEEVRAGRYMS